MEKNKLISLALSFVSFLIIRVKIKNAILFGSVASNNFDDESDIDLFIETDIKNKSKIINLLSLYKKTKEHENFKLEGIKNEISIKCGNLDNWKSLKRSIISNGIVLYGRYEENPEKLKHKILFTLTLKNVLRSKKIKIWRKIYGYNQKMNKKTYNFKGMAENKLGRGAFLASLENSQDIIDYLKKNKIKYTYFDIWIE
ncbi:MAG: nucleotidyltransferase domain-containing protein [Candidatus Woesearchaeota archaeon]